MAGNARPSASAWWRRRARARGFGRGLGAQDPGAGAEHERGRGHAREQRDLRVPVLGRNRHAVADGPRAVLVDDLLVGDREAHPAARALERQAALADLAQQRGDVRGHVVVGVLGDAADLGARDVGRDERSGRVEVERPQDGRAPHAREQARRALGEHGRVQRRVLVRRVDGDRAAVGLAVEGARARHEGAEVGDRVPHAVAAVAALDVERLVEVARPGRVDRHERQVDAVAPRRGGRRRPAPRPRSRARSRRRRRPRAGSRRSRRAARAPARRGSAVPASDGPVGAGDPHGGQYAAAFAPGRRAMSAADRHCPDRICPNPSGTASPTCRSSSKPTPSNT